MIAMCSFMTMNPKHLFYDRSKLLNESHFSLHDNVFPLIKRVKHLSEFSDFFASGSLSDLFILHVIKEWSASAVKL